MLNYSFLIKINRTETLDRGLGAGLTRAGMAAVGGVAAGRFGRVLAGVLSSSKPMAVLGFLEYMMAKDHKIFQSF